MPEQAGSLLQPFMDRCLAREPSDRYPSMKELVSDVRAARRRLESGAWPAVSRDSSAPSIPALEFSDMSPQKDQDYFCEGMVERYIDPLLMAGAALDMDSPIEWLEKAYKERRHLIHIKVDPGYDAVRSEPRFQDLVDA